MTKHIGLIATASSSYSEPYNLARTFASLDHISRGRAAWNVVTLAMDEEALNFGRDGNIEHANRYGRATEFLDTVTALWDSWEDEAVLIDKETGVFADPARVHRIEHNGPNFKVRGPLNVPRPPQGHPLIVQAGSSDAPSRRSFPRPIPRCRNASRISLKPSACLPRRACRTASR